MNLSLGRPFRLVARGGPGLSCDETGVALGGVQLVRTPGGDGSTGSDVRPVEGLGEVLRLAYGAQPVGVARSNGVSEVGWKMKANNFSISGILIAIVAGISHTGLFMIYEGKYPGSEFAGGWLTGTFLILYEAGFCSFVLSCILRLASKSGSRYALLLTLACSTPMLVYLMFPSLFWIAIPKGYFDGEPAPFDVTAAIDFLALITFSLSANLRLASRGHSPMWLLRGRGRDKRHTVP